MQYLYICQQPDNSDVMNWASVEGGLAQVEDKSQRWGEG